MSKKINMKATMILTIFVLTLFSMPIMGLSETTTEPQIEIAAKGDDDMRGMFMGFMGGIGGAFNGFGYGGEIIGNVIQMLFLQTVELDQRQIIPGVYVLNATQEHVVNGSMDFTAAGEDLEIHHLPWVDEDGDHTNDYDESGLDHNIYCEVDKKGGFNYSLTMGASMTLAIWDHDGSFIRVAKKIIDFMSKFNNATTNESKNALVAEGIGVLLYLIIHINDIFTGDELFVFNPIIWQKLEMTPWTETGKEFNITKTWRHTDNWMNIGNDPVVSPIRTGEWNDTAKANKDSYMQWLLRDESEETIAETVYTQFSFDVLQFWMKNFEIHINVTALTKLASGLTGGATTTPVTTQQAAPNIASIFSGLDIEFYIFTHHLFGAFLYDDNNSDGGLTVNYRDETYLDKNGVNQTVQVPDSNELTHQLVLGTVDQFKAIQPTKIDDNSFSWGLNLIGANITPVPMGVDLNSYMSGEQEKLDWIQFGLKFIKSEVPLPGGNTSATGRVKLQHNFAPWNGGSGPKSEITDLDMAIIYSSSIFYFHLNIQNTNQATAPNKTLLAESDYKKSQHKFQIGNYLNVTGAPLDFIDIAGEQYTLSNTFNATNKQPTGGTLHDANSTIIPVGYWNAQGEAHHFEIGDDTTDIDDFSTDIKLEISYNVMFYAICYPDFNGSGKGVWHDPTFSVYMLWTPNTTAFWALILLVAGIGLVGLAAVMIKRKKDRAI